MRRTKIVATIGPATSSPQVLEQLIGGGLDVARLNFSHGTHAEHGRILADIRQLATRLKRPIAILQDLAGPKVRTGPIADGTVGLVSGADFTLTSRDVPGSVQEVSLTYKDLPRQVLAGDTLLLSDGTLELTVEEVRGQDIRCRVVVGGELSSHKGINLPNRSLQTPSLTDKDREDLQFGLEHGVDYVALSFVRTARDVLEVRRIIEDAGRSVPLIAKIEQREAIEQIDAIIASVDGLMIARGDLGVEIPATDVPRVQKSLIEKANRAGKPVITATQMLKSMVESPHPTRAEVSDVANAILDGSDAVMLSEETAVGQHPLAAVQTMSRIAESIEEVFPFDTWEARLDHGRSLSPEEAVARASCRIADRIGAGAIITLTQSGATTRLVAKCRPRLPLLAVTPEEVTYRRLALVWGAVPFLGEARDQPEAMEQQAIGLAGGAGRVRPGDTVVITAGVPLHVPGTTNLIKIAVVP
jgi:pyruvate kinase